jgi:hypothetical protein
MRDETHLMRDKVKIIFNKVENVGNMIERSINSFKCMRDKNKQVGVFFKYWNENKKQCNNN